MKAFCSDALQFKGSEGNGAKLRHFWDGFGVGFCTGSGSGFEKDFLANGTHFFEDGFELLVGSDSLFQKVVKRVGPTHSHIYRRKLVRDGWIHLM